MQVITDFNIVASILKNKRTVITLGVFDGVHSGHIAVFKKLVSTAKECNCISLALTFDTHPNGIINRLTPPDIMTINERLELIESLGVDIAVVIEFDEFLRDMPADDFAKNILCSKLQAVEAVLGHDTVFGKNRSGNASTLRKAGLKVCEVAPVIINETVVSSTAIRSFVEAGNLEKAVKLLSRRVCVCGKVVHGKALGRTINVPTINLDLHHTLRPANGVYATWTLIDNKPFLSITNIGGNPTFSEAGSKELECKVETHILDFDKDIYGQDVKIVFALRLRDEVRFDSIQELKRAIEKDIKEARTKLNALTLEI